MSHHHHPHQKEQKSYDYIFYLVAMISGLFVGAIVERGFIWIPVGGVFGLLTAALFIKFLVRGREEV
ncbi:hypothetical protein FPZ43_09050 [Mucilaginibacter pallidiroseus]|uniref:Uncharacterized protein n=1 Tax=Mucilaginibacter pallidiroseus TaxID=2599295 RepID=A0A563UF43_9SPHI|nr:hypothetical protein [Mucilaginibacter pallidiroseus]TWR29984.1 hypothetical protein FPZ43_09050 [Mucilaginibacter pallidiroseus]